MAYRKDEWDKYKRYNALKGDDTKFVPLLQSMNGLQKYVQDVVNKFAKKNAAVRNGELTKAVSLHFDDVAVRNINGMLHYWNGRYYVPMKGKHGEDDFTTIMIRFMNNCNVQSEAYNAIPDIVRICTSVAKSREQKLMANKFVFKNGVYDTDTKTFTKGFDPSVIQINASDYDYEKQEPLLWRSFLNKVLPDKPSQDTLQMFLGAALLSRREAKIEKMMALFGTGANGKSVIYETVRGVLGENSVSSFGIDELISDKDKKVNLVGINGKRLNYCSEIRSFLGTNAYDDALKVLVSGEPIAARPMYEDNIILREIPLFMCNTNWNLEKIAMSPALRRRIIQLNFNVAIPVEVQDKTLQRKLEREYAGIFAWFVEGMEKLRGNEYKFPDEDKLPTPKEEYVDRKKIVGSTLFDVLLSYLTNNRFNYKMYGTRTSKFNMRLTSLKTNLEAYARSSGIIFAGKITTNGLSDLIIGKGGVITKSGGTRNVVLYATPEDVKAYREMHKRGEI